MYAPSNTYTTTNKRLILLMVVAIAFCLIPSGPALAQTDSGIIRPLKQSAPKRAKYDVFLYGAGSITRQKGILTANTNYYGYLNHPGLYNTHLDFGAGAELFHFDLLRLWASVGYGHERYAFNKSLTDNTGIYAHWLTLDFNISETYLSAGVNSAFFLNSLIRNDNHFSYDGIYNTCFNKIAVSVYMGIVYRLSGIKVEARLGYYITPQINPSALAYYNMQPSQIDGMYWEVRTSFRVFTTARRLKTLSYVN